MWQLYNLYVIKFLLNSYQILIKFLLNSYQNVIKFLLNSYKVITKLNRMYDIRDKRTQIIFMDREDY